MNPTGLRAVLLFTAILFVVAMLLPDDHTTDPTLTPWHVTLSPQGNSQLLGITLHESTLQQVTERWKETPKVTLFMGEKQQKVEAYFQQLNLGGIRASAVAEIAVTAEELQQLIDHGARISTQGDGSRKVLLDGVGMTLIEQRPISSLTYLPKADLPTNIIEKRFGLPSKIYPDPKEGIDHWLYPLMGLDIAVSNESKEVLQFVSPREIERLRGPLEALNAERATPPSS